jgi:hypothetical protein
MDSSAVLKLDDPNAGYNFDVDAFYQNIVDCNNGDPDSGLIFRDSSIPKCFFGLHFIRANNHVCSVDRSTVPDSVINDLALNDCPQRDACNGRCP